MAPGRLAEAIEGDQARDSAPHGQDEEVRRLATGLPVALADGLEMLGARAPGARVRQQ